MTAAIGIALAVKATVPLLLAAGVVRIVGDRWSAATRHAVWAIAIIGALGLPLATALMPPLRAPALESMLARPMAMLRRAADGASARNDRDAAASGSRVVVRSDTPAADGALDGVRIGEPRRETILIYAAAVLWGICAVILAGRNVAAHVRARRIVRDARPVSDPALQRRFAKWAARLGVPSTRLAITDQLAAPATVGIRRPVVLLPGDALTWSDADANAVFIHELSHVRRGDCLIDLVARVSCALYWFNPIAWLAARELTAERERACDDCVLQAGGEAETYAELLLRAARAMRMGALRPPAGALAMARPSELESRLLAVLDPRVRRGGMPHRSLLALSAVATMILAPTAALTLEAAPAPAPVAVAAPQLPVRDTLLPEPDRAGDSLANPRSELVPASAAASALRARALEGARSLSAGPDSALAARLVPGLDRVPQHAGDLVRERATWALGRARDGVLVEPLVDALGDADWRVRAYAAWALAHAGPTARRDPRIIPALVGQMEDPIWRMRASAAHALAMVGGSDAEPAMLRALRDPAWQVRIHAVDYLGVQGGPDAADRIRPYLSDRHLAVRMAAAEALSAISSNR